MQLQKVKRNNPIKYGDLVIFSENGKPKAKRVKIENIAELVMKKELYKVVDLTLITGES